jgi:hypothetical protein
MLLKFIIDVSKLSFPVVCLALTWKPLFVSSGLESTFFARLPTMDAFTDFRELFFLVLDLL